MSSNNKPLTSEAPASNATLRLDLPTLLGKLYDAQRGWERRHQRLTEKVAAKHVLRDLPQSHPEFCKGKLWPKWVKILKEIREGRRGIGNLTDEYRNAASRKVRSLRHFLVVAVTRAESRIDERLGEPLREYVVERLITECTVEFDDLCGLEDFEGHLRTYCESVANGTLSESGPTEFSRWIAGLERCFADDLLAELWTRFPRECERLGLPMLAGAPTSDKEAWILSAKDWVKMYELSEQEQNALEARLRRKRMTDPDGHWFREVTLPKKNEPAFTYQGSVILPMIDDLLKKRRVGTA